jgi:hypothetical protein
MRPRLTMGRLLLALVALGLAAFLLMRSAGAGAEAEARAYALQLEAETGVLGDSIAACKQRAKLLGLRLNQYATPEGDTARLARELREAEKDLSLYQEEFNAKVTARNRSLRGLR